MSPFPQTLSTMPFEHSTFGWFAICDCTPIAEDLPPSFIQHFKELFHSINSWRTTAKTGKGGGTINFVDQPPTFFILGFFITLTSFLLTILILNSQRRQAEEDRIRSEIEYRVNLKSQAEVMKLKLKIEQLIEMVGKLTNEKAPEDDDENAFI